MTRHGAGMDCGKQIFFKIFFFPQLSGASSICYGSRILQVVTGARV